MDMLQADIGGLTGGNITVSAGDKYSGYYDVLTPKHSENDPKYNDNVMTCKCCRAYNHGSRSNVGKP